MSMAGFVELPDGRTWLDDLRELAPLRLISAISNSSTTLEQRGRRLAETKLLALHPRSRPSYCSRARIAA